MDVKHLVMPEIALVLLISIYPTVARPLLVAGLITLLAICVHTMLTRTTGDNSLDYWIGCSVLGVTALNTILLTGLVDPMNDFRYLRDADPSHLASRSWLVRIWNSVCLIRNYRFVGWNVQVRIFSNTHGSGL